MKRLFMWAIAVVVCCVADQAFASGMLIPKDQSLPPLAIKNQRVNIRIKDGTATASIEQVFKNSVDRDLEAVYVFPLPENATIADFAMYINGKRVSGELVEKGKARQVYEDIVRRMKDPGLLEQMGGNLFRVSVYPVPRNGEQRIEISYSQTLEFESGLYKYIYPLKTTDRASSTLEDFTVKAELSSAVPIKNIYSPSHKIGIKRKGDNQAVIGFEEDRALLDKDFCLYYSVDKKDFGINLITHASKGKDGFFMMMLAPTVAPKDGKIVHRDVSFVFDTSGSMMGEKIKQTKDALKYCIRKLNHGDRFNIIRFSTDIDKLSDSFLDVNDKSLAKAEEFIVAVEARGGTAIDEAMSAALSAASKSDRPHVVVFLTDGKPTIGETDPKAILGNVKKCAGNQARIFVFGVGEDLNAHLLDSISTENGGVSQYVAPSEDIEVKVSSFADKINLPVLSKPKVTIDKLDVRMIHPQSLPDLFAGDQITIFGRYSGHGDYAIRLSGEINGKKEEFVFEGAFPKDNGDNDFIPRLWATRRVGYLLDEIRLHGEDKELKDEVVQLGKDYGIMTPYTSYLVLDSEQAYRDHGIERKSADKQESTVQLSGHRRDMPAEEAAFGMGSGAANSVADAAVPASVSVPLFVGTPRAAKGGERERESLGFYSSSAQGRVVSGAESAGEKLRKEDGKDAITMSKAIGRYKKAQSSQDDMGPMVKMVGQKIFYLANGVWTDRDYKPEMKTTKIKYASDEYFKLIEKKPELKKYLALGQKVIVCFDAEHAVVVE